MVLCVAQSGHFFPLVSSGVFLGALGRSLAPRVESHFSSILLLIGATLLILVARQATGRGDALRRYWQVLASLFTVMAAIKILPIYSGLVRLLRRIDATAGGLFSSSILLAASLIIAAGSGFYLLGFLVKLQPRLRYSFAAGGSLFLLGAIGMEWFSEWSWVTYGAESRAYAGADFAEMVFEMSGMIVFIDGLLFALRPAPRQAH